MFFCFFFFQAEDGIRDYKVTGVQTCALPISNDTLIQDQYGQASFSNLQSFLQGKVSTYTYAPSFTPLGWRSLEGAFYVEDAIRVKPSLELRIGFRAEFTNGWNEANGRASNYLFDSSGLI